MIAAVAVVLVVGATIVVISASDDGAVEATTPSASPEVMGPPVDLQADARAFQIVLSWKAPEGSVGAARFSVSRDDEFLGTVDAPTRRYVDDDVLPGQSYRYTVEAVDDAGASSAPASLAAETSTAPAASARLQGVFDLKLVRTSEYGVTGIAEKGTGGWRFVPVCAKGPCNVTWSDIQAKGLNGPAKRSGGTYTSTVTYRGYLECSGTPSSSSIAMTTHAERADAVGGAWRVTVISGTLKITNTAQLGCRSSGITYDVHGTLVH